MSDSLARGKLARPALVLMTDDERLPEPVAAARTLPRGSMVIIRSRDPANRKALLSAIRAVRRDLRILVAGDIALAVEADGLHLPESRLGEAAYWRARYRALRITGAAHSLAALGRARHVDAVFLSPVFPTRSHPGRAPLNPLRASLIARMALVPVYALGGMNARTARRLSPGVFAGIAAIDAFRSDVQAQVQENRVHRRALSAIVK